MNKHPKALAMLFFTEMWERFSFYGMRALLMLYLTKQLFEHILEPQNSSISYGIYAAYGSLVYATPFIGGLLADKFLGHKKAVIWGAILMAIGHFVMAIETEYGLYIALAFLILGNGFFKPNISSIVGELYNEGDIRRDGGFTIFYMGVNLGALLAPIFCGYLGETYGYQYGFGLAGIGMIAGLIIFRRFIHLLLIKEKINVSDDGLITIEETPADIGCEPQKEKLKAPIFFGINTEYIIYILSFVAIGLFALLVKNYEVMSYFLTPFAIGIFLLIFIKAIMSSRIERDRLFVVLILLVFTTLFWSFFEQAGSSLTLFTYGNVDRSFLNWVIPTSTFQAVNPFFIVALGSLFTMMWLMLARKKKEPNTPVKFSIGLLFLGFGFMALGIAPSFVSQTGLTIEKGTYTIFILAASVPMSILFLSYLLQTIGELCLSPIGLSMVTKLSSPKIVGMVMGAWFLSSAMAHHIAGIIAKTTTVEETTADVMWQNLESNYSSDTYTITHDDLKKDYKGLLSASLQKGFEVILIEGNDITRDKSETSFDNQRMIDSSFAYLRANKINDIIKDSTLFSQTLTNTYNIGIQHMIQVGDVASNLAIKEGYIYEKEVNSYSLTTRHSLSNLLQYTGVFWMLGIIAAGAALLLFAISPFIRKMMHGA